MMLYAMTCAYFVENKMLFWVSNQMLLWERVSMNLAVLINILVALFYPFSGTVTGKVKDKV
jgi:predicted membrane protein